MDPQYFYFYVFYFQFFIQSYFSFNYVFILKFIIVRRRTKYDVNAGIYLLPFLVLISNTEIMHIALIHAPLRISQF